MRYNKIIPWFLWFVTSLFFGVIFFGFVFAEHNKKIEQNTVEFFTQQNESWTATRIINDPRKLSNKRIAHAGGAYNWEIYTNSLDALEANKDDYELFEIDLSWTSDDTLVCIHDWEWSPINTFWVPYREEPMSFEEFTTAVASNEKYKNCTLDTLMTWLKDNPTKFLVTDIKERNLESLKRIAENYPDLQKKIIAQVYLPRNYQIVQDMWYEHIIWALYRYKWTTEEVLWNARTMNNIFALSLNVPRSQTDLPQKLESENFYTYVHTINDAETLIRLQNLWASEIMTDFLTPN